MSKHVLTIAGSDSSANAGVQADSRAFIYFGLPYCTAITAVTAQGTDGVTAVQFVQPDVLREQIEQAFKTYEIASVKVGMLGSKAQVSVVVDALSRYKPPIVVVDPVLQSTSGQTLLDEEGKEELISSLFPWTTILTPNVPELHALTGLPVESEEQRVFAARHLMDKGPRVVLVKGGHLGTADDLILYRDESPYCLEGHWVVRDELGGTGCLLSSLIAAGLCRDFTSNEPELTRYMDAMKVAKCALAMSFRNSPTGLNDSPQLIATHKPISEHDRLLSKIQGVYFVTDGSLRADVTTAVGSRLALEGGAKAVQLRDKRLNIPDLIELGHRIRRTTLNHGAAFIVNDHLDVALACDADGVHLGPDDMTPREARQILRWNRLIGASVSSVEEGRRVANDVSYLAVGAVFGSSTKNDAGAPVGIDRITEIKNAFPGKKIVAIGGINLSNIASVAAAGADAAAVVSAIVCAPDPENATRELLAEFNRGKAMRAEVRAP